MTARIHRRTALGMMAALPLIGAGPARAGGEGLTVRLFRPENIPAVQVTDTMTRALGRIFARLGWRIEVVEAPWVRGEMLLRQGALDAMLSIPNADRRDYVLFAETPVRPLAFDEIVYARNGPWASRIEQATSLDDLADLPVADYHGNAWTAEVRQGWDQVVFMRSIESMIRVVAAERVAFTLMPPPMGEQVIRALGLDDRLALRSVEMLNVRRRSLRFGMRRTFPDVERHVADFETALRVDQRDAAADWAVPTRP